jgi:hypothetical protein
LPTDLQTFALAFTAVWAGLALYLLRLHALARRLDMRLARLEKRG